MYLAEAVITAAEKQNEISVISDRINWNKVLSYINSNINEQIDFVSLAQSNNYSYDRFRHLFTQRFGLSPYTYLTKQRIEHAKRLLKNSNSSITDIAFDCGFNSSSQFTNIFKKYVRATPKEYKKATLKVHKSSKNGQ
ncbi:MAG: helix-turn-helix transcriptional regulator [Clostridia bacterium]|nr:helix-turn-helix transcriptional regulator [Clostridia bacterium]